MISSNKHDFIKMLKTYDECQPYLKSLTKNVNLTEYENVLKYINDTNYQKRNDA